MAGLPAIVSVEWQNMLSLWKVSVKLSIGVLCITWVTFSVVYCPLIQTHKGVIYNIKDL